MSARDLWIIEKRNADGSLNLTDPQPHQIFGMGAIHGMDDNAMAQVIFRKVPDAVMDGRFVAHWPQLIDPQFTARRKYW